MDKSAYAFRCTQRPEVWDSRELGSKVIVSP